MKNSIPHSSNIIVNNLNRSLVNILNEISISAADYEPDHTGAKYTSTPTKKRTFSEEKAGECASAGSVKEAHAGAECAIFLVDHDRMRGIWAEMVQGGGVGSPGFCG